MQQVIYIQQDMRRLGATDTPLTSEVEARPADKADGSTAPDLLSIVFSDALQDFLGARLGKVQKV